MTHPTQETVAFVALVVVLAAMVGWGLRERGAAVLDVVRAEARVTEGCVTVAVFGALGSEQALDELVRRTRGLARAIEEAGRSGSSLPEEPTKGC